MVCRFRRLSVYVVYVVYEYIPWSMVCVLFVINIDSVFWVFWGPMRTYRSSFNQSIDQVTNQQSIDQPTNQQAMQSANQTASCCFLTKLGFGGEAAHLKADRQTDRHADTTRHADRQDGQTEARRTARQTENADRQGGQTGYIGTGGGRRAGRQTDRQDTGGENRSRL